MAGGMSKRGDWGPMSERIKATAAHEGRGSEDTPPEIKHVWVTTTIGTTPGLLLEWRNLSGAWEGRVIHMVRDEHGWAMVEEWLGAGLLRPVGGES